jgi:hypothetical protein
MSLTQETGYESLYRSHNYHVINGRDLEKDKFQILPNTLDYSLKNYPVQRHPQSFARYVSKRVPIASEKYPPNEKRFDNIDKTPPIHTNF